jgi:hypothetical protein
MIEIEYAQSGSTIPSANLQQMRACEYEFLMKKSDPKFLNFAGTNAGRKPYE